MRKTLAMIAVSAALACGKRGDPRPPVPVIPKAATDLVVAQRGPKVFLSWSYPSLTTAGKSLTGLNRILVYRYVESLPVPAAGRDADAILPGDTDPTRPMALNAFAKIPTLSSAQFGRLRELRDSMDSATLPAASSGAKLTFEDDPPMHSADGRAVRINYAVVTEGESARSDLSNLATIVPIDVALPPEALTAVAKPQGIFLSWTVPAKGVAGGKPVISGYDIYRTPASANDEAPIAVNPAPVRGTTFTDTPPYGSYTYRVTAVSMAGPPRIESERSASVTATFKDLLPPPAPTGLTVLVETKATRLVWDAIEAADLAGYRVYRRGATGAPLLLTASPVKDLFYRDVSFEPGVSYVYSVTSVDKSGNESTAVNAEPVVVPKTP